jgi:hypothetical protein
MAGQTNGKVHSHTTTDHDEIRQWAEERQGKPACVIGTGEPGEVGLLRIDFPGGDKKDGEILQRISWDEWFDKFDDENLAFIFQE